MIENPFSNYGIIVYGSNFIGREDELKVIENRVIKPKNPGNLAIIGLPRIGKSSLAYQALMGNEQKNNLINDNKVPIWLNLATFDEPINFFRTLVSETINELDSLERLSEKIREKANSALAKNMTWSERIGKIQKFFQTVKKENLQIIFILDEFDHARFLFKDNISGFQTLRELSYRPEWKVVFVTTSRRSIRDIETQTQAISTFDGIFQKIYLGMFTEEDLKSHFNFYNKVGLNLTDPEKEKVLYYCGSFPYALEILGFEITQQKFDGRKIDVDEAVNYIYQSFIDFYNSIVDILKEDESLDKLLQVVLGPVINVKQTDIEEMLKYGLLRQTDDYFLTISEYFKNFLQIIEREVDFWPLWRKTEKDLRSIITSILTKKYGIQWISRIKKNHKLSDLIQKSLESQQKEEKIFKNRSFGNTLDYMYPRDLSSIIFEEWTNFKDVFKKDKNYWEQRFQLLAKIRNPYAHNRENTILEHEQQTAEGYCKEINFIISEYYKAEANL